MTDTIIRRRNEAPAKTERKMKMKTRNLLLTLGATILAAITINATASDTLLSPRAAGNQIKHASGTANSVNAVAANTATVSPRAAGNQIAKVAGTSNEVNPAIACAANMNGSPRAIQACVEHTTMPGCNAAAVASAK
jgi:hypothetical protein